jgi:chaperonin GroEL (HSP60 family)
MLRTGEHARNDDRHHGMRERVMACVGVAAAISSTLGPAAAHKLLVPNDLTSPSSCKFMTTNDGATLLRHLHLEVCDVSIACHANQPTKPSCLTTTTACNSQVDG